MLIPCIRKGSIAFHALRMLQQNCVIAQGIQGLNPDITDYNDQQAVNRWIKKHPKIKEWSEEKRAKKRELMKKINEERGKG